MAGNPQVVVDFIANTKDLKKGIDDAGSASSGFGSKLKSLGKIGALAGGAAGIGAVVATLKIGIDEYTEAAKVAAQTNAVIESTGGVAKVTAEHVATLAGNIMKKSGIDDEAIQSGENLLLTFTNLKNGVGKGNDIFDQTTRIMADMAAAMGSDPKQSAIQLGKALNDPVKGVSALSDVGVSFTEAQKKTIAAMVKSGDTMGAQKVILAELNKEFGGSAEALGNTLPGQINIAKQTFSNFAGELVSKMIPVIEEVIGWLRDHWPEIQKALSDAWASIQPTLKAIGDLVVAVVKVITDNWQTIGPIVQQVVTIIQGKLKIITDIIKIFTDILQGNWGAAWNQLKTMVGDILQDLVNELKLTGQLGSLLVAGAKALGKGILNGILAGLKGLADLAWELLAGIGQKIDDQILAIDAWGDRVGNSIKAAVVGALAGIGLAAWGVINNIGSFLLTVVGTVTKWGSDVATLIKDGVTGGIVGIGSDAWDKLKGIGTYLVGVKDDVTKWGTDLGGWFADGITSALGGIKAGLKGVIAGAINAAIEVVNKGLHAIRDHWPDVPGAPGPPKFLSGIPPVALAKGGVVSAPTLALLGEGGEREIVAPESLLRRLLTDAGAGAAGDVHVRVYLGDQELRGMVRTEVEGSNRTIARSLIAGSI